MSIKTIKVHSYEKGLFFRNKEFRQLLDAGRHYFFNPAVRDRVDVADLRDPWLRHKDLDLIVKSGVLNDAAEVLDLQDFQRALIWVDGRFQRIVSGGLYALWTTHRKVKVQIADAREVRFNHPDISVILKSEGVKEYLQEYNVAENHVGVMFRNGQYVETLSSGRYIFWKDVENVNIYHISMAETSLDIAGQEIMTADKVTLRMNAIVTYHVIDAQKSVRSTKDVNQSLYREAQLALRAIVGSRQLDDLLAEKDSVAEELKKMVAQRSADFGLQIISLGIRDVILPGEMKDLLNQVTGAKKAAEANLIARREETAAMRSQANTAKLLENNPVLMRLRELEILEKVSTNSKLNVVLGEKGLADRVMNLL